MIRNSTVATPLSFTPLPVVPVEWMSGFLDILLDNGGQEKLARLVSTWRIGLSELLPVVEAVQLLDFAQVNQDWICVTLPGRVFAGATIPNRKQLFREQVLEHSQLMAYMTHALRQQPNLEMDSRFFLDVLTQYFSDAEARQQVKLAIDWGRHADLFEYVPVTGQLRLQPVREYI